MRTFTLLSVVGLGTAGIVPRGEWHHHCSFKLEAVGEKCGPFCQIPDGQINLDANKGGPGDAEFHIHNGIMKDSKGRGCIITEPQKQVQCDWGNPGMPGFDINHWEHLTYHGCEDFWVCPLNDFEIYNVYIEPVPNQLKCVPVKVKIHSDCHPEPTEVEIIKEIIEVEKPCQHKGCTGWERPEVEEIIVEEIIVEDITVEKEDDYYNHHGHHDHDHHDHHDHHHNDHHDHHDHHYNDHHGHHHDDHHDHHHGHHHEERPSHTTIIETIVTAHPCDWCDHDDWHCNERCHRVTTTSTTTAVTTVTDWRPIPCQNCQNQNNCMDTCTVLATETATTTVWKPCVEKCHGNWDCLKRCHQPEPTCWSNDCGKWWDFDGHSEEQWGYLPKPWNYDGYWPYDQGRPHPGPWWKREAKPPIETKAPTPALMQEQKPVVMEKDVSDKIQSLERYIYEDGRYSDLETTKILANFTDSRYEHESRFRQCCNHCDYSGDPYSCHESCAFSECEPLCQFGTTNCLRKCQEVLYPPPCVAQHRCRDDWEAYRDQPCRECGFGRHYYYE